MEFKIQGKLINLRRPTKSDASLIYHNLKYWEITKYMSIPHPYTLKTAEDFIKTTHQRFRKKKAYQLGIEFKETKEIIGMIGLVRIDYRNKNAEIGYWLNKKYWGRGVSKEAVQLILNFGFKKLKLIRIYARVMHPNIASVKLLEKSGFKYEGRLRQAVLKKGKRMDYLLYSILRKEFKLKK